MEKVKNVIVNPQKGKNKVIVSHRLVEEGNEKRVGIGVGIFHLKSAPLTHISSRKPWRLL